MKISSLTLADVGFYHDKDLSLRFPFNPLNLVPDLCCALPDDDPWALCRVWLKVLKIEGDPVAYARNLDGSLTITVQEKPKIQARDWVKDLRDNWISMMEEHRAEQIRDQEDERNLLAFGRILTALEKKDRE